MTDNPGLQAILTSGGGLFGSRAAGGVLLGSEASGLAADFTALYPNLVIRDAVGSTNYAGDPFNANGGKITFTRASGATRVNSLGVIETVGNDVPRIDYDPVTLAAKGLLVEEQRTNLLLRSAEFDNASWSKSAATVTANVGVSPDGTSTAEKIVESATTAQHYILQSSTTTATAHTFSVYAKAGERSFILLQCDNPVVTQYFNVSAGSLGTATGSPISSITSVGNGWYRCVMTFTAVAATPAFYVILASANGTSSYAGDGTSGAFVYGAQLEAGSFATSYIPTTSATATRSADVASVSTQAFPYSATEGTIVANVSSLGSFSFNSLIELNDGTLNNRIGLRYNSGAVASYLVINGGVGQATINPAAPIASASKFGAVYKASDFAASYIGGAASTTASGTVPTSITKMEIGNYLATNTSQLNGHIRQITYLPRRISNAELQTRTSA